MHTTSASRFRAGASFVDAARALRSRVSRRCHQAVAVASLALAGPAMAATFTVSTTADTGAGSLRAAVTAANSAGGSNTIVFDATAFAQAGAPYTIQLESALPDLTNDLTLTGPGANIATIRGHGQDYSGFGTPNYFRFFTIPSGRTISVSGVTINGFRAAGTNGAEGTASATPTNGTAAVGGAIKNSGSLTLTSCVFTQNFAQGGAGGAGARDRGQNGGTGSNGSGGVIYSDGPALTITRSTFSGNGASGGGGGGGSNKDLGTRGNGSAAGHAWGGALYLAAVGTHTITNSTFYSNSASGGTGGTGGSDSSGNVLNGGAGGNGDGGAIYTLQPVTITSCTFNACSASAGNGGMQGFQYVGNATPGSAHGGALNAAAMITIGNTLVAGNSVTNGGTGAAQGPDVYGTFTSQSYNLVGSVDANATGFTAAADLKGTIATPLDPKVDTAGVANNGGSVTTLRLRRGSPAVDKGKDLGATGVDARGNLRPKELADGSYPNAVGGDGSDIGAFESQALPNDLPVVSSQTFNGAKGTAMTTAQISGSDPDGDTLTYSLASGTMPDGLMLNANGTITGTPSGPSQTTVTVVANDGLSDSLPATITLNIAEASSLVVTTDIDNSTTYDGLTSLREALNYAANQSGTPTITFDSTFFASAKTITLASGTLSISGNLTINGPAAGVTLSGGDTVGVFMIYGFDAITVNFKDLTFANGTTNSGGAMSLNNYGGIPTVKLTNCTFKNNAADSGFGGALYNNGANLTLLNCTLAGNHADGASAQGGAIYQLSGSLTVLNSTIALNHSTSGKGGGIAIAAGTFSLGNSIVADNTAATGNDIFAASLASQGYNLIGNSSGITATTGTTTGNQLNVSAGLNSAGLADNGGPTPTIALAAGSLALDAGKALGSATTDQRGQTRTNDQGGITNASGGDGTDIGAYEAGSLTASPSVTTPTATSIATTSATLGGNVTSDGGSAITARGVVIAPTATNAAPQLTGSGVTNLAGSASTGVFTVSASGLTAGTGYSYAAYATNSIGTTYSSVATFSTLSTNANLSGLALSAGTLSPAFGAGTTSYTVTVANAVSGLTVTPTAAQGNATITVNTNAVTSGAASGTISLNVGSTTITTIVTAQDAVTTKTYTVEVTRLPPAPVISGSLAASGTYGSAITTYTIAASNSPASYSATGLPSGLNINTANGQITGTPTDATGSPYSVTIGATNAGGAGTATLVFTVNKVGLTLSGFVVANKPYDGLLTAAITGTPTLVGVVGSDGVTLNSGSATATFNSKTIGDGKTVTAAGYALNGSAAANYTLTQPTTTANITVKALTVTGVTANNKVYDASDSAVLSTGSALLVGTAGGDSVTLNATAAAAAFSSKTVGTGKAVTITGLALAGSDASNYTLTQPSATADITAKGLTVTGTTATNKVYDGGLDATPVFTGASLTGTIGSDAVTLVSTGATATFATKIVETGKVVTVAGLTLSGADAANYSLTQPTTTANITQKPLTVTGITAVSRTYDATANATLTTTAAALVGAVTGDTVTLVKTAAAGAFSNKTAAIGKTVQVSGLTLSGADSANYSLTQPTTTADITAKSLTVVGVTASGKVYDGSTVATVSFGSASLVTVINSDAVTLSSGAATGAFTDTNAGLSKTIQVTGLTLVGADAPNYILTQPTATASITPASASIVITNLSFTYDGKPKAATITVSPAAATTVVYSGGGSAPTNAGTYTVAVSVTDSNYSGSGTATLTIAKAAQTVAFAIGGSDFAVGTVHSLTGTASSGLPVTFSVVSGSATLSGSSVTVTQSGAVTLRALQAGDGNYLAASADQGFSGSSVQKTAQTISFTALADRSVEESSFSVSATATSGLPVSFSVVSGPANVTGSTVTLGGSAGVVVIRASQAGNATYAAAANVDRAFEVYYPQGEVFFGDLVDDTGTSGDGLARGELIQAAGPRLDAKKGDIAAAYYVATKTGTVLIVAPSLGLNASVEFTVGENGAYSASFTGASRALVLTGSLSGSTLTGRIPALGVSFTTQVQPVTGSTAAVAGFYQSSNIASAGGGTTSIVGPAGQLLVVSSAGAGITGATGTVEADGSFTAQAAGVTIAGAIEAGTTTISGTVTAAGQAPVSFSGVAATTVRTDRLINLSSRVRIAPAANRTLITGFVIKGTGSKRLLLRAVGPALTGFGVSGALVNPKLQLFDSTGKVLLENDDWSGSETSAAFTQAGAFALTAGAKDAAVLATLAPGAYSMQVTAGAESGVGLAEIYDASSNPGTEAQRLVNISTRGTVDVGADGLLIGGFVVTGNTPKKVLIRGVGPALADFGVTGVLGDPRLAVYSGSTLVAQNDDWSAPTPISSQQTVATAAEITAAAQGVGAFSLGTAGKDAAVLVTLAPGAYTAQVSGVNGQTGVALVEIYEVP